MFNPLAVFSNVSGLLTVVVNAIRLRLADNAMPDAPGWSAARVAMVPSDFSRPTRLSQPSATNTECRTTSRLKGAASAEDLSTGSGAGLGCAAATPGTASNRLADNAPAAMNVECVGIVPPSPGTRAGCSEQSPLFP